MRRPWVLLWVIGSVFALEGCNRAGARIPGASLPFPRTPADFVSPSPSPLSIWIEPPRDLRSQHYGEPVAGTRWKACKTDPFWLTSAPSIVAEHLGTELEASRVFANVSLSPEGRASELRLSTEIHAFCSQAIGFLYLRVAGLTSLRFTVHRGSEILFDKKYERVVTDADPEYSGMQVAMIEQVMQRTMADSFREVLREFVPELAKHASGWK